MTTNGASYGVPNGAPHNFDPNFTQHVIDTIGPKATPRSREIFSSFIRHLHDFAREVELTTDEWLAAVKFTNWIGQISDSKRNEAHRMSDILGLESLVDEINYQHRQKLEATPTSSAILGPFWSPNAPFRELGGSIILSPHKGEVTMMHGIVSDAATKKPISNAVVDIWQASSNGKYDFQDSENQLDNNLRGKFKTDENGYYYFYCLRPTAYSLPTDGPSFQLLNLLDRHPMRPAHIHLMITHDDYKPLVNQIYPRDDPWLSTDTVFAVKDDLIVDFKPREGDCKAKLDLDFNITLVPRAPEESATPARL